MLRILIVGCGDVGLRAARLLRGRARVYGLLRSPERAAELRAAGVIPVPGDLDDRASLARLAGLADVVLHFAPPPPEGAADPRTRRLIGALGRASLPRTLIYVSTSGVYGDCAGAPVPETRPARPGNARARRRLDAERRLRAWAARTRVGLAILRAPGIYAGDRMPEERVRKGLPALLPEDDIYTNHIHAEDLAGLAVAALFRGRRNRVYNAVDDSGLKMADWFDVVADHIGVARPPRLARAEVMAAVTPAMRSFLSESRRMANRRLKTELRYALRYPSVREGLAGGA
ncbi:SDR family oxidoreductase [Parasulfuritortus cantonensis]|uniref:SDR family oxidoreductase n=1 Tax=Parasulfuritortus cantonensis TaxID=2528202 RepID=A0A4R1B5X8_9PROT|nr:SDR family oxidoreductase [Parasulfuritortus cantonensis]TCJ11947.1 SDR family oxidoreductase [Parasulfuritortus cantonensis]